MKTKAFLVLVVLILTVVLFWAFNPARGARIPAVKPQYSKAVQAVYATGTVEAVDMVPISPKVAARLMTLEVDEGSKVTKGQLLAQLEDTDLQHEIADLQAQADLAQKALARAQKLSRNGAIAKEALDQAQATYDSANASLARSKAETDYLKLLAPDDGTIIRRDGEIGELITVGTPVFWMNAKDQLRISTEVDEEDISLVQPGQNVVISADGFPGRIFHGKVLAITPKGDAVARSYRVRVSFDDDAPLMIGMTSETNIITKEKDRALMVPATAVKEGHVLKMAGGAVENIAVRTDIKTPQAIEITGGIGENDVIAQTYDAKLLNKGRFLPKITGWKVTDDSAVPASAK